MEHVGQHIVSFIESGGLLAPLLFISFHLIRPLFFLPVIFICISGGMLFGTIGGTLYSVIGITLSSILFYGLMHNMPKTFRRIFYLKEKWMGKRSLLTKKQIALLRLIPFIHFHLLSLCLIEISSSFKDYIKSSLITNIPFAFIYTSIGQGIVGLAPIYILAVSLVGIPFIYWLRRKEIHIKWNDFFQMTV
ncbi:TVP38/TMEM64 family protein [Virgibacillus sp. W0430]|uniref:TVP38/TMEM64 family protein n=1 Tax=Virgibacillus sp. W0430 TaxID=3391580 RepID=UPI003F455CE1